VTLSGPDLRRVAWRSEAGGEYVSGHTAVPALETATATPRPASTGGLIESPDASPSPTYTALEEGPQGGEDLEDVLLLFDSAHPTSFDKNLCRLAEYYGLVCAKLDLRTTPLADGLLRDGNGEYFKLVGTSASVLLGDSSLLSEEEVALIRGAVETSGVHLLVSNVRDDLDFARLSELTGGTVVGATKLPYSMDGWQVSSTAPEITRELTGQVISSWTAQLDFGLILGGARDEVTTLIAAGDGSGTTYPIFVMRRVGQGSLLIDGGQSDESLEEMALRDMYYDEDHFSKILPLMISLRYALGDETWHSDHDYANLTIDDPSLKVEWHDLSFVELLSHMNSHDFHTTIAFIPKTWTVTEPRVAHLFRSNPERYSLVQHGNNHDGYEFYKYVVSEDDEFEGEHLPARPLAEQDADILEGLTRMELHTWRSGVPYDRVMIFPQGVCPEPTLVLLKKHNYLATVNGQSIPLDADSPVSWDFGMRPANMEYGNFPMLVRRHPATYEPFQPQLRRFIYDLFIDRPALFYSHVGQLFRTGAHAFDSIADEVNGLEGNVEWQSLGYIVKHLCLEKENDDGSVAVRMYTPDLVFTNDSLAERTYHITKAETLNVPIGSLTVNGREFHYRVEDGLLSLDARVPPDTTVEIAIRYGD
jgi:hypothetical protein